MNEIAAAKCRSGGSARGSIPVSTWGSLAAIAPHFDGLPAAEQKAAIALMLEGGEQMAAIAAGLNRDEAAIETLRGLRCRRIISQGGTDPARSRSGPAIRTRPALKQQFDRAVDEALGVIDAHRVQAGANRDAAFEMTLDAFCHASGTGFDAARRRLKELESRRWIRRTIRAGQPPLLQIVLAGRRRLAALDRGAQS